MMNKRKAKTGTPNLPIHLPLAHLNSFSRQEVPSDKRKYLICSYIKNFKNKLTVSARNFVTLITAIFITYKLNGY